MILQLLLTFKMLVLIIKASRTSKILITWLKVFVFTHCMVGGINTPCLHTVSGTRDMLGSHTRSQRSGWTFHRPPEAVATPCPSLESCAGDDRVDLRAASSPALPNDVSVITTPPPHTHTLPPPPPHPRRCATLGERR